MTDNEDGTLSVTLTPANVKYEFENKYNAEGSTVLTGSKVLTGKALEAGQFSFTLVSAEGNTKTYSETVTNAADGTFEFPALEYTLEDLKEGSGYLASREFGYILTEAHGGDRKSVV